MGESKTDVIWAATGSKIMNLISSVHFSFSIYLFFFFKQLLNRNSFYKLRYSETYSDAYNFYSNIKLDLDFSFLVFNWSKCLIYNSRGLNKEVVLPTNIFKHYWNLLKFSELKTVSVYIIHNITFIFKLHRTCLLMKGNNRTGFF